MSKIVASLPQTDRGSENKYVEILAITMRTGFKKINYVIWKESLSEYPCNIWTSSTSVIIKFNNMAEFYSGVSV